MGDIFDKHIHAAMDVTVFTAYGETRTIKKGEWIGVLFSYAIVMGEPALLLYGDGGYFGKRTYYLRYYGPNTIDDKLLRYNYRNDKWVTLTTVRSRPMRVSVALIAASVCGSSADVASSSTRTSGRRTRARAREMRCS